MLQCDNIVNATAAAAAAAAAATGATILVVVAAAVAMMRNLVVATAGEHRCVGGRQLRNGCVECRTGAGAAHAQHGATAAISDGRV